MINVVFYFPIVRVASQHIQKIRWGLIKPRMLWKALMTSFMHDIETNNSKIKTQDETKENRNQGDGSKEDNGNINASRRKNEYRALEIQLPIASGV